MRLKVLFSFSLMFLITAATGQVSIKDSSVFVPVIAGTGGFQLPGGDLANRFGANFNVGSSFFIKTKSNWLAGIEFDYLFGDKIKEDSIFRYIETSDGNIIDGNGMFAEVNLYERGYYLAGKIGKIIPAIGPNPNSGLLFTASVGLLQHKIRIENKDNTAPQLKGDYKKGYDRLTNGLGIKGFAGYIHMSNSRLANFYAGVEVIYAQTQSRRDYTFDLHMKDTKNRSDFLYGIKFGWMIPLYKRLPQKYYFN